MWVRTRGGSTLFDHNIKPVANVYVIMLFRKGVKLTRCHVKAALLLCIFQTVKSALKLKVF